MFLNVEHHLNFFYDSYISESFLEVRLEPRSSAHQTVYSLVLALGPTAKVYRYVDWNDNAVHHFSIARFHKAIKVSSRFFVNTHPSFAPLAAVRDPTPLPGLDYTAHDFLQLEGPVAPTALLERFHRSLNVPDNALLGDQVQELGTRIHERFRYEKNVTRFDSTTDDFLKTGAGVCQDFTHLMLAVLRLRGIPCRYVSGYLHVPPKKGRRRQEPAQSHAWIEFYSPADGWVGFDPTHNHEIDERYIVVGYGRYYDDVPPNKGIYKGRAKETMSAAVWIRPSSQKDISSRHAEIQEIDVPVFQEVPDRRVERALGPRDDGDSQQQQQQQRGPCGSPGAAGRLRGLGGFVGSTVR